MLICLHIAYSCYSVATAALNSSERDVTAQNSKYLLSAPSHTHEKLTKSYEGDCQSCDT